MHPHDLHMNTDKLQFLKQEFIPLLQKIKPDTLPAWGKMNPQQMVEHFSSAVDLASGRIVLGHQLNPSDQQKAYAFLITEKPFRENTRNAFLPEQPLPVRHHTLQAAINELQAALIFFFETFEKEPGKRVMNPIFGNLDYAEQVQLLHKHALHHLKQFGSGPLIRS
jgi:hypothetical protein